jgi:hypothetical protein
MRRLCLIACLLLAGCETAAGVRDAWCAGATEEAKQALRDRYTGGEPVIACPKPARDQPQAKER